MMQTLDNIIRVHYGKSLKADARNASGRWPVYGSNGEVGKHNQALVSNPTLIIGRKGSVGSVTFAPEGGWVIDTAFYTEIIDPGEVDLRYLYYALRELRLEKHKIVTSIPGIGRDDIYKSAIPLPPLPEQMRIAAILDKADAIRRKRAQALQLTDQFLQSVFLDMFGDPVTNPKGWDEVQFRSVCKRLTVGIVVRPASYYVEKGVPALRSLNVKNGSITCENLVYFSKEDNETKLSKTRLNEGDLVLIRSGKPGTAAVVPKELDGVNAIDLLITTLDKERAEPDFLCNFFNSAGGRQLALKDQRGQIQQHLNVRELGEATIPLPPLSLQSKFVEQARSIQLLKESQAQSAVMVESNFATLVQRSFRGEL